jgi:hypothetical protein
VKGGYRAIFDLIEGEGLKALAAGRRRARRFIAKRTPLFPSAVACVEKNLKALLACLRFPAGHRKRIRHSSFIERTFGETRRRVKVIGRLPGERSCLRASKGWRGITMSPKALRLLQDLRRQLPEPSAGLQPDAGDQVITETATATAWHQIGARVRRRLHQC